MTGDTLYFRKPPDEFSGGSGDFWSAWPSRRRFDKFSGLKRPRTSVWLSVGPEIIITGMEHQRERAENILIKKNAQSIASQNSASNTFCMLTYCETSLSTAFPGTWGFDIMNGGPVHVEVLIRGARPTQAFEVGNPWCRWCQIVGLSDSTFSTGMLISRSNAVFQPVVRNCPSMALILRPAITSCDLVMAEVTHYVTMRYYDLLPTLTLNAHRELLLTPRQDRFFGTTLEGPGERSSDTRTKNAVWCLLAAANSADKSLLARLHKVKCNAFAGDITISVHCCPSFHLKHGNVDLFRACVLTEHLTDQQEVW